MKRKLFSILAIMSILLVLVAGSTMPVLAAVEWSEDWDSYAADQDMHGVGGWKGWDNNPAYSANTSSSEFRSSFYSIAIAGASDLVHEFDIAEGVWLFTAWQFVPSAFAGYSYFIMLNQYEDSGTKNWSVQVAINGTGDLVVDDVSGGNSLPLIKDQWVEIMVKIDLEADWQRFYYGGQLLYERSWSEGISGGGVTSIAALDLFANGSSTVYYDDLSLISILPVVVEKEIATSADGPWHESIGPLMGGASLYYRMIVSNTGAVDLEGVTVSDPGLGVTCNVSNLQVDASYICGPYGPFPAEYSGGDEKCNTATASGTALNITVSHNDTACYTTRQMAVGGKAYPVNGVAIAAPWIVLVAAVIAGAVVVARRRLGQS